ncbi:hypothetical protein ACPCJT_20220 [Streptomyces griseoincarnatus]
MRVRMRVTISGTRDGEPWPERGSVVDLPDDEAKAMVAGGLAEEASSEPAEEQAVNPAEPEKATGRRGKPMTKSTVEK